MGAWNLVKTRSKSYNGMDEFKKLFLETEERHKAEREKMFERKYKCIPRKFESPRRKRRRKTQNRKRS